MKIIKKSILFVALFVSYIFSYGQDNDLVLNLNFDDPKQIPMLKSEDDMELAEKSFTKEIISGKNFKIYGLSKYVPGVKNSAIRFDGFSSYVEGNLPELNGTEIRDNISIEAWISLGAYPWNWAPIITLGRYEITGFYFGIDSKGRLGFHVSDGTSTWHECNSKLNPETKAGLELKKWVHVVGTFSTKNGLAVYINGKLSGTYNEFVFPRKIMYSELDKGFRLGKNRIDLAPADPVRSWATFPSQYSLDAIIDEVKIYRKMLSAEEVNMLFKKVIPEN